jgi:hypothetical protein
LRRSWNRGAAAVYSLPFKGRVRVGMGARCVSPISLPTYPLKGEENAAIARLSESFNPHNSRMNHE